MANIFLFQYQQHTEPVSTLPETVTESRWHQPLSEPKRLKQISIALIASGLIFTPPQIEIINADKWFKSFQEPVRVKPGLSAAANPFLAYTPQPDPADDLFAARVVALSEPVRVKPRLVTGANPPFFYAAQPDPPDDLGGAWIEQLSIPAATKKFLAAEQPFLFFVAPSGEVITADKWYWQFSDPVRRVATATRYEQITTDTDPVVSFSWFGELRDPSRRTPVATRYEQQSWSLFPDTVTYSWLTPWPDLVRRVQPTRYEQPSWSLSGEVITTDKWFRQFNDPVRRTATATRYEQLSIDTDPVVTFSWFGELRDPSRPKPPVATQAYQFFIAPSGEIITVDKWFEQFTDPPKGKPNPTRYEQPSWSLFPDFANNMGWFDNLSDPASVKRLKLSEYLFFVAPSGEITSPDKWYRQFNDPVRRIATATRYEQPSWSLFPDNVTYSWLTPWPDLVRRVPPTRYEQPSWSLPGEISSVDKWFSSLSDPTRRKGLATALNPSFFYDPPPFIVSYSWFGELRDPVRRPPMATRYEQQSWSLFVEPTAVTFGWFDNLSDPTRRNPDLGAYQRVRYPFAAIAARMSWYAPLSNPVRLPIGIKVQLQPYFQYSPNPTTITSFGWFDNLSDPVRKRPMATRYEQPSWSLFREDAKFTANQFTDPVRIPRPVPHSYFVTSLFPPTPSFGWFGGLSEPVRIKPRVRWLDEQSFQFPFTPLPGSWYAPWREPTPPKRRNPFFQPFTFTATPPIIPSFGWYGSLSNPRWNKPKVWEGQYQAWNPATINFSYLARMDAYETRDFLVAVLYAFNPPLRAYVDIIEKDPRHRGEMGVIENAPEPSIIASIVTPQAIPATGTPIAAVRARVAIIVS